MVAILSSVNINQIYRALAHDVDIINAHKNNSIFNRLDKAVEGQGANFDISNSLYELIIAARTATAATATACLMPGTSTLSASTTYPALLTAVLCSTEQSTTSATRILRALRAPMAAATTCNSIRLAECTRSDCVYSIEADSS